jgi:uncharacterized repeat protein (TIGR03847 family)
MNEAHNEMGRIARLKADAVGEPGERYFRLIADSLEGRSVVMWMEKEQLFRLGEALLELAAETQKEGMFSGDPPSPVESIQPIPGLELEFQVGRLSVQYDPDLALFIISVYDENDSDDALPVVNLMATHEEVEAFAEEAFIVCAAGRPVCSLCGAPMEKEFHMCPALNGNDGLEI